MPHDGAADIHWAAGELAARLPEALAPLAEVAYNYRWSWTQEGDAVFGSLAPQRWEYGQHNPVMQLRDLPQHLLNRAEGDGDLAARVQALAGAVRAAVSEPMRPPPGLDGPVAFFCAEFAVHRSLPIYSGGLGALAGDILKEASDRGLPCAGIGLFYRQGYFHQRVDGSGWQHEWWTRSDPVNLPMALVHRGDEPLVVAVPMRGHEVHARVWRVDVGRVPLFLLDTQVPENSRIDRWITSRLYIADRETRLNQYALLGIGGMRALAAMGIEPAVVHLNEGHAALAPLEWAAQQVGAGAAFDEALERVRERTVFTTHTPVAAGNESFDAAEFLSLVPHLPQALGTDADTLLGLGRVHPEDGAERFGLTPLGIRVSRSANAVSRRHGVVARGMWRAMFDGRVEEDVPVGHVTNGVHRPSWMAEPMQRLLDRHLGREWRTRPRDPEVTRAFEQIPDGELWAVRRQLRSDLVEYARERSVADRLDRGESMDYVEAAYRRFSPDALTLGFARRIATYKRLYLITADPGRAARLLTGGHPVQLLIAGKAHPQDDEAKGLVQGLFPMKRDPVVAGQVAFLQDYDLGMAAALVSGCDVWINLPRPPLEASGTSGMKAALNGSVNLSVLDGWWEEAWDGDNGWGIRSDPELGWSEQDAADVAEVYRLLEEEIVPLFWDRGSDGIPHGWLRRVRASIRTAVTQFGADRMLEDYVSGVYSVPAADRAAI